MNKLLIITPTTSQTYKKVDPATCFIPLLLTLTKLIFYWQTIKRKRI